MMVRVRRWRDHAPGGLSGGAPFGAGFPDRGQQLIAGDARQRQVVLGAAFHRAHRRQFAAVVGEHDAIQRGLHLQHLRHVVQRGRRPLLRRQSRPAE